MAGTFAFEITTPEKTVFTAQVKQVSLPTQTGEITVLPHHIPIVSIIVPGVLHIRLESGEEQLLAVSGGFVEVQGKKVVVLADSAERADEIDEARAEEARQRAQEAMANRKNDVEFGAATANLERQLARIRAVRRWKGHHRAGADHTPNPIQ